MIALLCIVTSIDLTAQWREDWLLAVVVNHAIVADSAVCIVEAWS